ncbi:MAG: AEC family transporter [Sulfurovaceae bacterium]|jgi:malate permease and related proteins
MIDVFISIIFIYAFISLGYLSKVFFKEDINTKTLTLLSVYFFQPFVALWGFGTASLHVEHISVPFLYIFIILIVLLPSILISKKLFSDKKEQVIFSITGFVGNTGNIGIPLGIALFGQESVIYTTLINLANVFVVYMLGVYIYSRGSFDVKTSLLNIIKIPIIPASIIAIILNVNSIEYGKQIEEFLKMGAYSGIVIQLFLLGTFLQGVKLAKINLRLLTGVFSQKFILLPLLSIIILNLTPLSSFAKAVIFMEMMMPLAITNINLASLYDCRPKDITALILLSTLLFLPLLFLLNTIINMLYL